MKDKRFLTVTALTKYIKRKFDVDPHLQQVWLKAELSNVKQHSRGHLYFTLKDANARIQGVMFSGNNQQLNFKPENGMKVLVSGEITVFEGYGQYQIYVSEMQPDGVGNLYLAYEELKRKLHSEGLFAPEKKKVLPKYPETIGVITSPTGAAIRDIVSTIKRRSPASKIIVFPALVQGNHAANSIVKALDAANQLGGIDVLIVGRGGGSIEDLWPFNEEVVARAIFTSSVPIISAVGHETDYTIADFVADLRAPTPTGAAELAVPHIEELKDRLSQRRQRLYRAVKEKVVGEKNKWKRLEQSYAFRSPEKLYRQKEQELDRVLDRLEKEANRYYEKKKDHLKHIRIRLDQLHPHTQLLQEVERTQKVTSSLEKGLAIHLKKKELLFGQVVSKFNALNPLKVMERGYSLVYDKNKKIIKSVSQINVNDAIHIQLKDGTLQSRVIGKEAKGNNE